MQKPTTRHFVLGRRAVLEIGVMYGQVGGVMRVVEGMAVRVVPRLDERDALGAAHLDGVVLDGRQGTFGRRFRRHGGGFWFGHGSPLLGRSLDRKSVV